jgi:putative polyhydroxyalkanoate system protein
LEALLTFLQNTLSATAQLRDNRVVFSGKGFSGSLSLGEDRVDGSVQLGILMRPMKGAITREIERALEEYLQDQ